MSPPAFILKHKHKYTRCVIIWYEKFSIGNIYCRTTIWYIWKNIGLNDFFLLPGHFSGEVIKPQYQEKFVMTIETFSHKHKSIERWQSHRTMKRNLKQKWRLHIYRANGTLQVLREKTQKQKQIKKQAYFTWHNELRRNMFKSETTRSIRNQLFPPHGFQRWRQQSGYFVTLIGIYIFIRLILIFNITILLLSKSFIHKFNHIL